ncbi:hypothetical protein MXM59_04105 [Mammaliicoccus sciuri]|uniref:hypothetical protein n=1 Tax=Mammaliicoccus sciuri TaxID=1296 RepID=UPI002DB9F135|nr:hypothetical protein [Mammaliicoccus sciuri]MEB6226395.1 hypothetical protein [Mammaliicoccus sciuri]
MNKVAEKYLDDFLSSYRNAVKNRMISQYNSNPETFPFMEDENYYIGLIKLNDKFFEYSDVVIITNKNINDLNLDYRNQDNVELSKTATKYIRQPIEYIFDVLKIFNFDDYKTFINIVHHFDDFKEYKNYRGKNFQRDGSKLAEKHLKNYEKLSTERMSSKKHGKVSPFNHLKLDDMVRVVDDKTFEYQINQGLEAYKRELYLPAAATFAVAIETFLIKLKRLNNIKHKDSDSTMYDKLIENLKERDKINYRTKRRIEVAYSMRNIINHTQAGAVAKADCDFLLTTLKDIVDQNQTIFLANQSSRSESNSLE